MIRLLYTADWHMRGSNPRNRTDDYKEALKAKLLECFQLAKKWEVEAILTPGDIWDSFVVSIGTLLEFADFINEHSHGIPIITTFGQHDVQGYNAASLYRTSLALLERLVPNIKIYTSPDQVAYLIGDKGVPEVAVTFTPYSRKMDLNGYGYSPEADILQNLPSIHVAHGTLLDHEPPFEKFTLVEDVVTTADLVLTGDYHPGYGLIKRPDGKVFYNPGSLTRTKASEAEIAREIAVGLITVDGRDIDVKTLKLLSAKPGDEVLDRSRIEAEKERAYAMDTFSALMQTKTGGVVLLDINSIVEAIATQEATAPHIVKAALELIDAQRENVTA